MITDNHELQRLSRIVDKVATASPTDLAKFLHQREHRTKRSPLKQLVIKPLSTNQPIIGIHSKHREISNFIHTFEFTTPSTWLFSHTQITGPIALNLHGQEYLAFVKKRIDRSHTFGFFMKQLPYWARIGTPMLVSFAFCWLLARSLTRPLSNLAKVAEQLGQGNLAVRVKKDDKRNDEFGSLAKTFNQMADKLADNVSSHQRLLGDVSHELRSPLTRLQLALALAQKNQSDGEQLAQYIARSEREVERLDEMIEHVLMLSRLENSAQTINKQACQITPLLSSLVEDGNFIASEKQVEITLTANTTPTLIADEVLLLSAINNIIGNAIKYAPAHSEIQVELTETEQQVMISISDQGEGVPNEVLSKLFDPFYRVNDARDRSSGGTGLGLAIAKQAIIAHQGEITAQNNHNGGLSVYIKLPK